MFTVKPLADNYHFIKCQSESGSACFGISSVFRMTFALFIFHALIILLILPRNDCASMIHDGGWPLKLILIVAIFIGFFWVDISFFQVWAEICRYVSILFMLMQALYIIAGAFTFNEYMIKSQTNDENWKMGVLAFYTTIMTIASFTIIVLCFFWFIGAGRVPAG